MITIQDLQEAIAECEGQRNPNANTCIKLAAYYVIMDHMAKDMNRMTKEKAEEQKPVVMTYSRKEPETIAADGDTEFLQYVRGMRTNDLLVVVDELMSTLQVLNPRLYDGVMRRIKET